eukprot:2875589-Pyramimonas_sp.AAC.1
MGMPLQHTSGDGSEHSEREAQPIGDFSELDGANTTMVHLSDYETTLETRKVRAAEVEGHA